MLEYLDRRCVTALAFGVHAKRELDRAAPRVRLPQNRAELVAHGNRHADHRHQCGPTPDEPQLRLTFHDGTSLHPLQAKSNAGEEEGDPVRAVLELSLIHI